MLANLGLSQCDENVYRAMLHHPRAEVGELAAYLEVDEKAVCQSLDRLIDLSLVRASDAGLRAVRPQAGLMLLLARAEAEVAARQRQIEATRSAIISIAAEFSGHGSADVVTRLEGIEAVRDRLAELVWETEWECCSFSGGGAEAPDTIEAAKPLNQTALRRGVLIRGVYQDSFRNDPATVAYVRWMAKLGGHCRSVPILPMRLVIVDRRTALVPIDPADSRAGALEIYIPGVVTGLVALFEQVWDSGRPFGEAPARDGDGLTDQERHLLKLLAAGHTDESAARKLAVSTRSVQRMMTVLTERLRAVSRFQAGVEATRRGWVA
ncbi:LuxR family transcriptional regulator [Plantactinospora sp. S1510]|uniref:LuxR family transcriptional regulator n=1 Tax=Plantactinospora alkalitolerans TaxID=2789879 RepID=A0ABS0H1G3_9ACTN|nr:LuxR family transcriptional regulator [Plantactinospora alkalitolerans]MBF9132009.1 LuxR family transcriptional regulator [Plantactinospora alkalitolerans]